MWKVHACFEIEFHMRIIYIFHLYFHFIVEIFTQKENPFHYHIIYLEVEIEFSMQLLLWLI